MTITRRWQAGLESDTTNSATAEFTLNSGAGVSSTCAKTGTYSLRLILSQYVEQNIIPTRQARTGFHMRSTGTMATSHPYIASARSASGALVGLWFVDSNTLGLVANNTQVATYAFTSTMTGFKHIGLDCNVDSSSGWAYVYIDGIQVLSYTGDTGSNNITKLRYGPSSKGSFDNFVYYDDMFIDDTTGQGAAAVVPDRRFYPTTPNDNGNYSQGVGSDGNSASNNLLVDDRPHNSDTDYIVLSNADEKETYAQTTACPPSGFTFAAVIPYVYA